MVCLRLNWILAYTQPTHLIFGIVKYHHNIYYCIKHQMCELCAGVDMVILYPPTHKPRTWFGTVILIVVIFYQTKNQVGWLCLGGVSIQPGDILLTQKNTIFINNLRNMLTENLTGKLVGLLDGKFGFLSKVGCVESQLCGLCVRGDMAILPWNKPKVKWPYLRLYTTHVPDFCYIYIVSILYHIKN